jgi:hypothetical protein
MKEERTMIEQQLAEAEAPKKSRRKLTKEVVENGVKITVLGGDKGEMFFDFTKYPVEIQSKLGPFGQGHKLGDAAAGRSGKEAEDCIIKVHDGMMANDWTTRAPAVPKVKVSELIENFQKMSDKEKKVAAPLLAALGIELPAA